jgi:hypothetical protein
MLSTSLPMAVGVAQEDVEFLLLLVDLAEGDPADGRLDRLLDGADIEPVAGHGLPVETTPMVFWPVNCSTWTSRPPGPTTGFP